MFRGSAYSIESDRDNINKSELIEQQIRVALVGTDDVGKSSMLSCIDNEPFREDINSTKGVQLRFKKLRMNNYAINLYIWDGPGDKMEEYLREEQFNAMDGLLYVFDLTDRQSLHQIENLHHLIKQQYSKTKKTVIALLAGNKADLLMKVRTPNEGDKQTDYLAERFAKREEMPYLKVSAKRNTSVKDSFVELIKLVLVSRCKGRASRIFNEEEIGGNKHSESTGCSCCKSLSSCNLCAIF